MIVSALHMERSSWELDVPLARQTLSDLAENNPSFPRRLFGTFRAIFDIMTPSCILISCVLFTLAVDPSFSQHVVRGSISASDAVTTGEATIPARGGAFLPSQGTVRALAVFVQFKNDNTQDGHWRLGELPEWAYHFASEVRDYYAAMSFGQFTLVTDIYPKMMITSRTEIEYASSRQNYGDVNKEVLTNISNTLNFAPYDNWTQRAQYDVLRGSDRQVDIIMMIFRSVTNNLILKFSGVSDLGFPYYVYVDNGERIIYGGYGRMDLPFDASSSGITVCKSPGSGLVLDEVSAVRLVTHEFGHKILGGSHFAVNWALLGLLSDQGGGAGMHSFERQLLGYINYIVPPPNKDTTIILRDYMTTGDACLICVPGTQDQYYVLENRQQVSSYDEARDKGLYVYLATHDAYYNYVDIQTADGKWDWVVDGNTVRKTTPNPISGFSHLEKVKIGDIIYYPPSFEGDASDAFTVGYNAVYAPYTNPSSNAESSEGQNVFTGVAIKVVAELNDAVVVSIAYNVPPIPPSALVVTGSRLRPVLRWAANPEVNIVGYKIYRAWIADGDCVSTADFCEIGSSSGTTYTDSSLFEVRQKRMYPNCSYFVRAINDQRKLSEPSNYVSLSAPKRAWIVQDGAFSPSTGQDSITVGTERLSPAAFLHTYPNPFNPVTTISYRLLAFAHVKLHVYDMLGRSVATLVDGNESVGLHSVEFSARGLAGGVYFCRLTVEGENSGVSVETKRMLLVK